MSDRDATRARGTVASAAARLHEEGRGRERSELGCFLSLVELKHFPVPARLSATDGLGGPELVVELDVRDRDTGERSTIRTTSWCELSRIPEAERLDFFARRVRQALKDALAHEVDEALHVAGVRVFDPHRGER